MKITVSAAELSAIVIEHFSRRLGLPVEAATASVSIAKEKVTAVVTFPSPEEPEPVTRRAALPASRSVSIPPAGGTAASASLPLNAKAGQESSGAQGSLV